MITGPPSPPRRRAHSSGQLTHFHVPKLAHQSPTPRQDCRWDGGSPHPPHEADQAVLQWFPWISVGTRANFHLVVAITGSLAHWVAGSGAPFFHGLGKLARLHGQVPGQILVRFANSLKAAPDKRAPQNQHRTSFNW